MLLPAGRLDLRLDVSVWRKPLDAMTVPGLAVFFRAGPDAPFPRVGTFAGLIGRRTAGDVIHVRLRGLRRLEALTPAAGSGSLVDVAIDAGGGEVAAPKLDHLSTLLRRYHAALAEHGDRADIDVTLPEAPDAAVYRVASLLRISAHEQQFLLEAETLEDRVQRVTAVLRRETELLRRSMGSKGA